MGGNSLLISGAWTYILHFVQDRPRLSRHVGRPIYPVTNEMSCGAIRPASARFVRQGEAGDLFLIYYVIFFYLRQF